MNVDEKKTQLIKRGRGVGTAIMCPTLGVPFLMIAATDDDLLSLLVIRCGLEPESVSAEKFRKLRVGYVKGGQD